MARYRHTIKLVRPNEILTVTTDHSKPDQPSVIVGRNNGVMIHWGNERWEFIPMHRVQRITHSKIND